MKIFISADIEGITGIGHWNETDKAHPNEYSWFQNQMTAEVAIAAEAAIEAGATEILIKDAHDYDLNRKILQIAYNKKELTYLECKYQFVLEVLEDKQYLNDNILGKFYDRDFK